MTFDDDMLALNLTVGRKLIPLKAVGLSWPPPARLHFAPDAIREAEDRDLPGAVMVRVSMSAITDEQRAGMTHIFRGAEYRYEVNP